MHLERLVARCRDHINQKRIWLLKEQVISELEAKKAELLDEISEEQAKFQAINMEDIEKRVEDLRQ